MSEGRASGPSARWQVAVIGSGACEEEVGGVAARPRRWAGGWREAGVDGRLRRPRRGDGGGGRGAAEAGGTVIGIVPGSSIEEANPHCTHVVATGIGHARNLAVVASGEAVIAVGGEWGTLSEIGHARTSAAWSR